MDPELPAPPVVAVVVTSDAGPWLEEALASLAAQDYPALSVLVIDAASAEDPTARVAAVLPNAYIRRLAVNPGFAAAANEVLGMVEGAAFYAFCHDDVVLAPDAIRLLVEEAVRSNAGIVGPKLVDWDEPGRLLQVGLSADFAGVPAGLVERGELDQEQHDAVRDVLAVPGGLMLVRADLFAELGGFDGAMALHNEDVDLCWRANLAGARVLVVPDAVARHLEALPRRRPDDDRRRLQARHRLRSALKCYGPLSLALVLPRLVLSHAGEAAYALIAGRRSQAADIAAAWTWNLANGRSLLRARRAAQRARRVPDRDVRRLQVRGSARLAAFIRGHGGEDRAVALAAAARELVSSLRNRDRRPAVITWAVAALVLLFGSRGLIAGRVPSVGGIVALPEHATDLLRHWASGWRTVGLGTDEPAPTAFGLLGLAGLLLAGGMGLLQKALVLGAIPAGALGAWRLARPLAASSPAARLAAPVVYLSVPLPYNALARGRWDALVAYAVAPFVLGRLLAVTGLEPWDRNRRSVRAHAVPLALTLAVAGSLAPAIVPVALVAAVGLVAGSVVAGSVRTAGRALGLAIAGAAGAVVLCMPWSLSFVLPGGAWSSVVGGLSRAPAGGLGALVRFQTGPWGAAPLGWAVAVAASLPLLIGRDWRVAWAGRLWVVALSCWALAWTAQRGWLPVAAPEPGVVLAPAAAALALAVALGVVAFVVDLRGYHFGWRQGVSVGAAVAGALAVVPVLGASVGGRWGMPTQDWAQALGWMRADRARGDARVLWVGDPEVLPGDAWEAGGGLAFVLSRDGAPTVLDRWPPPVDGPTRLVPDALGVARRGATVRLGRLLAPMAVRYIALPLRPAPGSGLVRRPPADLVAALDGQLDLRRRPSDPGMVLYENVAAAPIRGLLGGPVPAAAPPGGADLSRAHPVLRAGAGPVGATGRLVRPGTVLLSEAASGRWELRVGGRPVARQRAFGWATAFRVPVAGAAVLRYRTPLAYRGLLGVQVLLWAAAVRAARRGRVQWRQAAAAAGAPAEPAGAAA